MTSFTLRQMEAFVWVAALGSFRKAATKLNTTQPAISTRIATLEDQLGQRLFIRDAGQVQLTSAGQMLLPKARRLISMADDISAGEGSEKQRGILRLGVAETIVHSWLPDFLKALSRRFPLVDVDVLVDVTVNLRNELIDHRLDLAFLMGPVSEYRIGNVELPAFPLVWVASPDLTLPDTPVVPLAALIEHPVITYARTTRPYAELRQRLSDLHGPLPRIFPVSSLAASLRMALDGVGIAVLPQTMVMEHLASGALSTVRCEWTPQELVFTASYPSEPMNALAHRAAELAREVAVEWEARIAG
jgi:DNA-binding transcriptional LysR family regulator